MTRAQPHRPPSWVSWWAVVCRRAWPLLAFSALAGVLVVLIATGWAGWLLAHPGQAWRWVVTHWLAASALGVIVAALGVIVPVVMSNRERRRGEEAAAERDRQRHEQQQQRDRQLREQATAAQQVAWEQRCRSLLKVWPLPTIETANPYAIGVFYSRRAAKHAQPDQRPPYVPRAADRTLAELLHTHPLVLVKGQSRAGKSRTAFEVAARELAGWRLLVPNGRAGLAGLAQLARLPGEGEQVLVWLENLEKYLAVEDANGLDAGVLARLAGCDPPMKVLATIRLEEHGRLVGTSGELGHTVRELLNRFDPGAITLPVGFDTPEEQAAIARLYPGEPVTGGLAEYLAAAHELVDRLEDGEASVPAGAGLVLAAVDWRRAGLDRPVSRAELVELLPLYMARLRPLVPLGEGEVDQGFGWATTPVGRTAALLVPDPDLVAGTFRVEDPVLDFVERRDGPRLAIPAVWQRLLGLVSVEEVMDVGFAAQTRGEVAAARAAWQQVLASGHQDEVPWAATTLGNLLKEQGDAAGARAAWQQAIDSGDQAAAALAGNNLGRLLEEQGDLAGARAAYQLAIDSGHQDAAPMAALNLGVLLEEQGDAAGARAAYLTAIGFGHQSSSPMAADNLGVLLYEQGDVAGARAAYQQAIDSGHQNAAPMAAFNLALMLEEWGDVAGARAAYQLVIDSGHQEAAARARRGLDNLVQHAR